MTAALPEAGGWREIRIGLAVVLVLTVSLLGFWLARVGNPFNERYSLVFFVENAKGLQEGAAVRLSGLVVGEVARVDVMGAAPVLRARYADRLQGMNIRIAFDVDGRYREEITDRSSVRIGSQGVSGLRYVRIEKGGVGGKPLPSGSRIPVAASLDVEYLLDRGAEMLSEVASLNRSAAQVAEKVRSGSGSLGRFLRNPHDNPLSENWKAMNTMAANVMRDLNEGSGTLALERRTGRIRANLDRFERDVAEIQRKVRSGRGGLGAFASDTSLPNALARLQARAAGLEARLDRGEGSLGRFLNDPEVFEQLDRLTVELDGLMKRIARDPLGSVDVDLH